MTLYYKPKNRKVIVRNDTVKKKVKQLMLDMREAETNTWSSNKIKVYGSQQVSNSPFVF